MMVLLLRSDRSGLERLMILEAALVILFGLIMLEAVIMVKKLGEQYNRIVF